MADSRRCSPKANVIRKRGLKNAVKRSEMRSGCDQPRRAHAAFLLRDGQGGGGRYRVAVILASGQIERECYGENARACPDIEDARGVVDESPSAVFDQVLGLGAGDQYQPVDEKGCGRKNSCVPVMCWIGSWRARPRGWRPYTPKVAVRWTSRSGWVSRSVFVRRMACCRSNSASRRAVGLGASCKDSFPRWLR